METFLIDVPVPSMGATVNEMTVIDLLVAPGARITKGQKVAELESDKSVFDFEAPCDGTIVAVKGRAGDILSSGAPFLSIETSDESLKHLESKETGGGRREAATKVGPAVPPAAAGSSLPPVSRRPTAASVQWTPRAIKLAQEAGLDPAHAIGITATGPGGRVSGDDVAQYLAARSAAAPRGANPAAQRAAEEFQAFAEETVCVAGIGFAVPKSVRPNSDILKAFPHMTEAEVVKLTGIQERRYAAEDETAACERD
jgi:pyruvate/2-oxoglutarate dehydrogenase complex dihydrolipoamide acyltransferase (E2) component